MSKIRINELARELEVKPGKIIDLLPELGVTDKKTHSSSLDDDIANLVRVHFGAPPVESTSEPSLFDREPDQERSQEVPAAAAPAPPAAPPAAKQAEPVLVPPTPLPAPIAAIEPERPVPPAAPAPPPPPAPHSAVEEPKRAAMPIRPPLATGRPSVPSIPIPPARPATPPPPPTPSSPLLPPLAKGPAVPKTPSLPSPPPPAPTGPRPGQILSGPRQPMPPGFETPRAPAPGPPTAPPTPAAPRPAPPRPPAPPIAQTLPGNGGHRQTGVIGQPPPRPVVPPRPDMVARLTQTQPKAAAPGQPAPRPMAPRPGAPAPGQPIYRGPIRPGQPIVRGPALPGAGGGFAGQYPGGRLARGRGMHPTTPLPPEPTPVPTADTRRHPPKPGHKREREIEEGKLLPIHARQREEQVVAVNKEITIGEGITVKELSEKLGIKSSVVIKKLVERRIFATINQTLDIKLAEDLAASFGAASSRMSFEEESSWEVELAEDTANVLPRAPVVTVMGHVDHGKTSLLDSIRSAEVAAHEAGGITQHIGAYQIRHNDKKIVFIDTPGHEAFTRMRARGAKVTDIVILVVAADDGVMPQTLEAIDHAKAAKVPIIVAINKIDKPDAQLERIKQQLSDRGLLAEDWGGDVIMVPVSAKTKQGIELLLEMILLVTEMQTLRANPARPAVCTVLEAKLDRGRGPVATILVRNGTLRIGDNFICGTVFSRVRALVDDHGESIREAEPSTPVEVLGLESLPEVGDSLQVVTDTAKAKQIVMFRELKVREAALAKTNKLTLESFHKQLKEGETKELNIIIKADVGGSAEVLGEALQNLSNDKVRIKVIHTGVGAITETDVLLASASEAIVIGFNVRPERNAAAVADQEKVDIRLHTIIYEMTSEIKKAMTGMLDPVFKEIYKGRAEVREAFRITKVGMVAGCYIQDGQITRVCQVRVLRDNIVVHTGKIEGLRRFKDDVKEVSQGFECGISIANFSDIKPKDILEAFVTEKVAQEGA